LEASEVNVFKVSKKDTTRFLIKNSENFKSDQQLKFLDKNKKLLAIGKILKCNDKVCLAKVEKQRKDFKLQVNSKLFISESKKEIIKGKAPKNHNLFSSIGGAPVSFGMKAGYQNCSILKNYCFDGNLAIVSASLGNVSVSGLYTGIGASRFLKQFGKHLKSYLHLDLGTMDTTLDFSNVDENNFKATERIYFIGGSFRVLYEVTQKVSLFSSLGYSLNTFKDSYGEANDKYNVAYSSGFLLLDLGASYRF